MIDYARAFGFREWPFRVVVDEVFSQVWADRTQLKHEIDRRLGTIASLPHSTVQLMWADFGAGKSHTLRHIEGICLHSDPRRLIPIYTELPPDLDGLSGLFQRFSETFPEDLLMEIGRKASSGLGSGGGAGARDLRQALKLLATGGATEASIAKDWFSAQPGVPNLRVLKSYNISSRMEEDGRIVEVLAELVRLVHTTEKGRAVVWLIDEYQRTADLAHRRRESLSQGFVSLFNKCTAGLHLVLSFSVAQQSAVAALIPQALRSRASLFPMLSLPFLTTEESTQFVADLLAAFRVNGDKSKLFPFTHEAFHLVMNHVESSSKSGITPRYLMEVLSQLLFELYDRANGDPRLPLQPEECKAALEQLPSPS